MVVKIYISGISGNKDVKKRQQRVVMILESKGIPYEIVDITEPGKENEKEFMQKNSKLKDNERNPLPPQMFNDQEYCGDYDDFDLSNEIDELEKFLKVPRSEGAKSSNGTLNGTNSREASADRVIPAPVQVEQSIVESSVTTQESVVEEKVSDEKNEEENQAQDAEDDEEQE